MSSSLIEHLRHRIQHQGPLSFRDFMDEALYHPEFGYYTSGRTAIGPAGDFYTSSDLDPVFGKLLVRKFQEMAARLNLTEDEFTIVELGAGRGLLAREVLKWSRFPYVILERSPSMQAIQREVLRDLPVRWIDALPGHVTGCVFSNEFFDALPVHRVVKRNGTLREIYVTADFKEVEGELSEPIVAPLAEGQFADINTEGLRWIERIAASLDRGFHLAIDYGYLDREFYARPCGTLMCYWKHQLVEDPYLHVGEQDMTAHVNFSDLMKVGRENGLNAEPLSTQMDFLIGLGILQEIASLAPAQSVEAIERIASIKKLILPDRMGERFKVLIQSKGIEMGE